GTGTRRRRDSEPRRGLALGDGRMRRPRPARVPADGAGDRPGDPERGQALSASPASGNGDIAVARTSKAPTLPSGGGGDQLTAEGTIAAQDLVLVLDFGSQYSQLIARRVREAGVYCELVSGTTPWSELEARKPAGLILSGGPASVYEAGAPRLDPAALRSGVPILGICYGMQLIAHHLGGEVAPAAKREYGPAVLAVSEGDRLFEGLPEELPVWMSHGDQVLRVPEGFRSVASSANSPIAALSNGAGILGIQFHPEVHHTPQGKDILRNFVRKICGCSGTWTPGSFVRSAVESIRATVGAGRVICALSGGVDSTVAATLVHHAIGDQLTCVFVNNGLLRRDEPERVLDVLHGNLDLRIR